jgi:hypothetical protein
MSCKQETNREEVPTMSRFDSIHSRRFATEIWTRKTYGTLRGNVVKNVSRNADGTFRASTNRSPETPVPFQPRDYS